MKNDTAVELEMPVTKSLMNLFTTEDGTVGPVLKGIETPKWLAKKARTGDPRALSWDSLSFNEKRRLIGDAARGKGQYFFTDRKISGIKIRDSLPVRVSEPIEFLGETLKPGRRVLRPREFLEDYVEFRDPDSVKNLQGVEIHFRVKRSAGEVSEAATVFQAITEGKITHQHVHVVTPLPRAILELQGPERNIAAGRITEFWRRANLFAHITGNFQGYAGYKIENSTGTVFNMLNYGDLSVVFDWLAGRRAALKADAKMPWIGFHSSEKYDEKNLYGFQFRRINADDDLVLRRQTLDSIQAMAEKEEYGISKEQFKNWLGTHHIDPASLSDVRSRVAESWPMSEMFDAGSLKSVSELELLPDFKDEKFVELLEYYHRKNRDVFFVLYRWSDDILFFDKPEAKTVILNAQKEAVAELKKIAQTKKGEARLAASRQVLLKFWRDSRIAEAVAESLQTELYLVPEFPDGLVKGITPEERDTLKNALQNSGKKQK